MFSTRTNVFQIITNKYPQYEMEITGSSKGQPTSVAQSFGVRRIHTFAWDVGILVSRRNWNIPRITWSIIPIVQEFQGGHATTKKKKDILGPIQSRGGKKRWPLWPIADQSSEKQRQKRGCHSPVSPPRHDPHGGILRVPIGSNFTLLKRQTEELSEFKPSHFVVSS